MAHSSTFPNGHTASIEMTVRLIPWLRWFNRRRVRTAHDLATSQITAAWNEAGREHVATLSPEERERIYGITPDQWDRENAEEQA